MRRTVIEMLKATFADWSDDEAPRLGASLAYYTLLSLAPLLVVVIAIVGLVFGTDVARGRIMGETEGLVGRQGAEAISTMIEGAQKPAAGAIATLLGVATLLFGASGVFVELRSALNRIWEAAPQPQSSGIVGFIRERIFSLGMVLAIGFLLLVSMVVSAALAATGKFASGILPIPEPLVHLLNAAVSFAVITTLFAVLFKYLPDVAITWNDVWIGAAATAFLFVVGKFVIGLYLGKASIGSAYGTAGSVIVILVWIYYSAQIFFFGAEFTQVYSTRYGSHLQPRSDVGAGPMKVAGWRRA